ncbi:hypothetical protein WB401_45735 [Streptomyces brasiliscabiei]|uniref:Uncharacterized protein n=1 Tax=Streptomyces brasiliscabiei TaxID=2736302 RepID=A0ABU8GTT5_9ACTN
MEHGPGSHVHPTLCIHARPPSGDWRFEATTGGGPWTEA